MSKDEYKFKGAYDPNSFFKGFTSKDSDNDTFVQVEGGQYVDLKDVKKLKENKSKPKKLKEAFPPNKIGWDIYVIFKKMPDLLPNLKKAGGNNAYITFKSSSSGSKMVKEDDDFKGILTMYSGDKISQIPINTKQPNNWKIISVKVSYSLKDIEKELNT